MIFPILSNPVEMPSGKADFLLAASVTKTCEIKGITQAGIPGKIPLTPTLDAELIATGQVFSMPELAETPSGVPTPALITRAVEELSPFAALKILNLGLVTPPQNCELIDFGLTPSQNIIQGAGIDVQAVFDKGRDFARSYTPSGDYVILGESTPAGTTTALASVLKLGYDLQDAFSSSFADVPSRLKQTVVDQAFRNVLVDMNTLERLSLVSDNMLIFSAGFVLEASKRFPVVLGGGTQMAAALIIADTLALEQEIEFDADNIYLATTAWVRNDVNSDIAAILKALSFEPKALYSAFDFSDSSLEILKRYDQGEAKEGVGAGAAIAYALSHQIQNSDIVHKIEQFLTV